jgi:hypothetical protein
VSMSPCCKTVRAGPISSYQTAFMTFLSGCYGAREFAPD